MLALVGDSKRFRKHIMLYILVVKSQPIMLNCAKVHYVQCKPAVFLLYVRPDFK